MYGTAADVAALARIWTQNGEWVDPVEDYAITGTNPTLSTVETWIENISAQMDIALGSNWFSVPVDPDATPAAYKAISQYVCSLVADQCYLVNGVQREVSPMGKVMDDLSKWVTKNADGLIKLGLSQVATPSIKNQASFRVIGTI